MEFLGTVVEGTLWACVAAVVILAIVMFVVDWFHLSGWWAVAAAVAIVAIATLVPHGWSYLQLTMSDRPPFELMGSRLTADDYLALAKYRFWGSLIGCVVSLFGYEYLKKEHF